MAGCNPGAVIIGLGANVPGVKGSVRSNIEGAIEYLRLSPSMKGLQVARLYESEAVGPGQQNNYVNTAVKLETTLSPFALLRALKQIEARFGRRGYGIRWAGRVLDLDIIDWKGRVLNWRGRRPEYMVRGGIILPHAHAHEREFVLKPLLDVNPSWVHPVLKIRGSQLLDRLDKSSVAAICEII